jgi:superfamily II DNA or RNA helicase
MTHSFGDASGGSQHAELAHLLHEVENLRQENRRLERLLGLSGPRPLPDEQARRPLFGGAPGPVNASSPTSDKLLFFRYLFAGRDDVYALRWENDRTGRSGWMPAVEGGFRRGQQNRTYLPLTDEVIAAHLTGTIHAGLYPLMPDDRCQLLACDFDGSGALLDALAYTKAARAADIPTALEVSRSGTGAHVWAFFTGPVEATIARRIGAGLLREAIAMRGELDLSSYDRFFPSQDFLPRSGSIGNLIALPLQGSCRRHGTTVFLDLATLEPHADQFAYLSQIERITPRRAAALAEAMRPLVVGPSARDLFASHATKLHPQPPAVIHARLHAGISVERKGLPPALLGALKHAASLPNPEFSKREKLRLSTYQTPRFIRCYQEDLDFIHLPRGLRDIAERLISQAGSRLELSDHRPDPPRQEIVFNAQLSPAQEAALAAMAENELGVLVAPPGAGKTVIACALVARLGLPALVLVDRTALLDQWRGQIQDLLGVKPGQLGGGRRKRTGLVDLASLQTLARRDDIGELLDGYGLVIADECHHVPAPTVDRALRQVRARRWLGLTATPYRSDGLEQMILLQCGPVRHQVSLASAGHPVAVAERRVVLVHSTAFEYEGPGDPSQPGVLQDVYRKLITDSDRNSQILSDVQEALDRGRNCIVLTNRTAHVEFLTESLRAYGRTPVPLYGKLSAKERRNAVESLQSSPSGRPILTVATGSYVGEGFDCPALDTVFLVFPMKSKGQVVQYVGRILRAYPGKDCVEVHDYVDDLVPVLAYTHDKRRVAYDSLGFVPSTYPRTADLSVMAHTRHDRR